MTLQELVVKTAENLNMSQKDARNVIDTIARLIVDDLKAGNPVKFGTIGTFKPVTRAARTARNPRTGEVINVPEKKTVVFRPSKELLEQLK